MTTQPPTTSTATVPKASTARRNPNISKWNILFDKTTTSWLSFTPFAGQIAYPCYACRDIFRSKNSFVDHVNRRSILLRYRCPLCPKGGILLFYNPCAFHLHVRQHFSLVSGEIYLARLEVCNLPFGMGGFLPYQGIAMLYDVEENRIADNMYINSRFYGPNYSDRGNPIIKMQPCELFFLYSSPPGGTAVTLVLKQISSNIPCCQFVTWTNSQISIVQNIIRKTNAEGVPAATNASVAANRNQAQVKVPEPEPAVAPTPCEAPQNVPSPNTGESYGVCHECKVQQSVSMTSHFLGNNRPTNEDLACSECKFVASTKCSLQAHQRIHGMVPPFICPECGREFKACDALCLHMNEVCFHMAKQVRYKCPAKRCTKLFAQNVPFSIHFAQHMDLSYKCVTCQTVFPSLAEFEAHKKADCVSEKIYTCKVCVESDDIYTAEKCESHIQFHTTDKQLGTYVYVCRSCKSYFRSTLRFANHLLRCLKIGLEPTKPPVTVTYITSCPACNALVKCKSSADMKTMQVCHNCETVVTETNSLFVNSEDGCCVLCAAKVSDDGEKAHMKVCKFGKPFVNMGGSLTIQVRKLESPKSDDSGKKKRKRYSINGRNKKPALIEPVLDLQAEEPMEFDGVYRCKLCGFSHSKRSDFHKHVKEHRDISTAYQCMECGECFVVKPSLIKHLQYFHQVSGLADYFECNDCFDKGAVEELNEVMKLAPGETKGPVAENQCRVCLKQFRNGLEMSKHFRVHGMAFLMKNTK